MILFLSGIPSQRQFTELKSKLLTAFTVVPAAVRDHVEAAPLKNACMSKGLNASGVDCLIAACAIVGNHELFAVDDDFAAIARHAPLRLFRGHDVAFFILQSAFSLPLDSTRASAVLGAGR